MPVDLRFGENIIQAYLQGRQLAEAERKALAEEQLDRERLEAQVKQVEERLKFDRDKEAAEAKIRDTLSQLQIEEFKQKTQKGLSTGELTGTFEQPAISDADLINIINNISSTGGVPLRGLGNISTETPFGKVTAQNPFAFAQQLGQRELLAQAPLLGEKSRLTRQEKIAEAAANFARFQAEEGIRQAGKRELASGKLEADKILADIKGEWAVKARKAGKAEKSITSADIMLQEGMEAKAEAAKLGQVKLGTSAVDTKVLGLIEKSGAKYFPPESLENLKLINAVTPILKDIGEIIDLLPKSAWGVPATMARSFVFGTTIKAKLDQIKSRSPRLAEFAGEKGRKAEGDIQRAMDGMISGKITKAQAEERLQKLTRDFVLQINESILGGLSDKQKFAVIHGNGFNPQNFLIATRVGYLPKFRQLDRDEGKYKAGEWLVLDSIKQKYVAFGNEE